jgi:hypothetical protein
MPERLRIIDDLPICDEAAMEVASHLDEPLGLVKDHSYDGRYYIVEWEDEDDA